MLHGKSKEGKFSGEIEVQTFVFTYKFPDNFTEEGILLKKVIVECNRKDVFRTDLIQCYINADWDCFA